MDLGVAGVLTIKLKVTYLGPDSYDYSYGVWGDALLS